MMFPETKAKSKPDADRALKALYEQRLPFDIPTLFLHPEQYKGVGQDKSADLIGQKLKDFTGACFPPHVANRVLSFYAEDEIEFWAKEISRQNNQDSYAYAQAYTIKIGLADHFNPADYNDPLCNVVMPYPRHLQPREILAGRLGLDADEVKTPPGFAEQWQFMVAAHEVAHGTGAGEPQAEMMAALLYRKNFEDKAVLECWADMRAIKAVISAHDSDQSDLYGWSMVEAVDNVLSMTDDEIDKMDEGSLKNVRFKQFETLREPLQAVMVALCQDHFEEYCENNLSVMARVLQDKMDKHPEMENEPHFKIGRRFVKAVNRLQHGAAAYDAEQTVQASPRHKPGFQANLNL